jgi:hypothetical protein
MRDYWRLYTTLQRLSQIVLFKNERMRIQRVILLIEVWVYIPCEQSPLRRFTSEGMPQIRRLDKILTAYN